MGNEQMIPTFDHPDGHCLHLRVYLYVEYGHTSTTLSIGFTAVSTHFCTWFTWSLPVSRLTHCCTVTMMECLIKRHTYMYIYTTAAIWNWDDKSCWHRVGETLLCSGKYSLSLDYGLYLNRARAGTNCRLQSQIYWLGCLYLPTCRCCVLGTMEAAVQCTAIRSVKVK